MQRTALIEPRVEPAPQDRCRWLRSPDKDAPPPPVDISGMAVLLVVAVEAPRSLTIIVELSVVAGDTLIFEGTAEHSPVSLLTGCNTAAPLGVSPEL